MPFDVEAARKAGATDDEILQHLTKSRQFDIDGALKAGATRDDIINYLATTPPKSSQSINLFAEPGKPVGPKPSVMLPEDLPSRIIGMGTGALAGAPNPLSMVAGGILGGLTTGDENVGGSAASNVVSALLNRFIPSGGKLMTAAKGAAEGGAFHLGQTAAGQESNAGTSVGAGAAVPLATRFGLEKLIRNPVLNSLFEKSRTAKDDVLAALGLSEPKNVSQLPSRVGEAVDDFRTQVKQPLIAANEAKRGALAELDAAKAGRREAALGVENQKIDKQGLVSQAAEGRRTAQKALLSARDYRMIAQGKLKDLEDELAKTADPKSPLMQQARRAALQEVGNRWAARMNELDEILQKEEFFTPADVRGVPFLFSQRSGDLAERLLNTENVRDIVPEIADFYRLDAAENAKKQLLKGLPPMSRNKPGEEPIDEELKEMAEQYFSGRLRSQVVKERLSRDLSSALGDIDDVDFLAQMAAERPRFAAFPETPETKFLKGFKRVNNSRVPPNTPVTPEIPAEVVGLENAVKATEKTVAEGQVVESNARQQLLDATQDVQRAREMPIDRRPLIEARGDVERARTVLERARDALKGAKDVSDDMMFKAGVDNTTLRGLRQIANSAPDKLLADLGTGRHERAVQMARTLRTLFSKDEETLGALTAGAMTQLVNTASDAKGIIRNINQHWGKSRSVMAELVQDESKLKKLDQLFADLDKLNNRPKHRGVLGTSLGVSGLTMGYHIAQGHYQSAAAHAAVGGIGAVIIRWPHIIEAALENPTFGKRLHQWATNPDLGEMGSRMMFRTLKNIAERNAQSVTPSDRAPETARTQPRQ